jgi:hypothetical protein
MPGWNRLSAGLYLDDVRKFFGDPHGGRDYTPELSQISIPVRHRRAVLHPQWPSPPKCVYGNLLADRFFSGMRGTTWHGE